MKKEKEPAKWKPINLKKFNQGIKKLRKEIGIKRLKEIAYAPKEDK